MPRVLLATEGAVDEVVIIALCRARLGCSTEDIVPKRFPARGIVQVLRLATDVARAAHFGYYDILILHADADDTADHAAHGAAAPHSGCHLCALEERVEMTLRALEPRQGVAPLSVRYAFPKQSTDAWLLWGRDGGDAADMEQASRHLVKERLFGRTKFGHADQARTLVPPLLARLRRGEQGPPQLMAFVSALGSVWQDAL